MVDINLTTGESVQVNSIFCIGRNYIEHIHELNNAKPTDPIVFTKPVAAINISPDIHLPSMSQDVHYETEIVVLLGKGGKNIAKEDALTHIRAYGVGLDLTARDLQGKAKEAGLPWALAKGFDDAACLSTFVSAQDINPTDPITFTMTLNGHRVQNGDSTKMIFSIADQIAYLSQFVTLRAGDLLFTGTPEGVGPLHSGDSIELTLLDKVRANFGVR